MKRKQVVDNLECGFGATAQAFLPRRLPLSGAQQTQFAAAVARHFRVGRGASSGNAARLLALILLLSLCVAGCQKKEEDGFRPTKLMPPLYSGYSLEKVQRELNLKSGDWEVFEDRRPLVGDKRPPFRMLTISREGWTEFGVSGKLVMTFYNDRLMTTLFFPTQLEMLRRALAREAAINFTAQGDARIDPATRIWVGKDREGRSYIGWIDLELERQQEEWIAKYER